MQALVVYESMFGNTKMVAEAVVDGMTPHLATELSEVGETPPRIGDDVGLLVLGGPTHAFGMSRPGTRQQAAGEVTRPLVSQGPGLREWLETLEARSELPVATFDTAMKKFRRLGTAGRSAGKRLRRLGLKPVSAAETFYVEGTTGPLAEGEEARAREWGARLALDVLAKYPWSDRART